MKNNVTLRCYAEGSEGHWEAICLDYDIAVQGKTFDDVYHNLRSMIEDYVSTASSYPKDDRDRLLSRKAPLSLRLKFTLLYVLAFLFGFRPDKERHNFTAQAACVA